jgi:hypothetical protein
VTVRLVSCVHGFVSFVVLLTSLNRLNNSSFFFSFMPMLHAHAHAFYSTST